MRDPKPPVALAVAQDQSRTLSLTSIEKPDLLKDNHTTTGVMCKGRSKDTPIQEQPETKTSKHMGSSIAKKSGQEIQHLTEISLNKVEVKRL